MSGGAVAEFPKMAENEYEWISHTAFAGRKGVTLYRHRMSNRPVMVFQDEDQYTTIWIPQPTLNDIKARF